jgi:hypothetical protein
MIPVSNGEDGPRPYHPLVSYVASDARSRHYQAANGLGHPIVPGIVLLKNSQALFWDAPPDLEVTSGLDLKA